MTLVSVAVRIAIQGAEKKIRGGNKSAHDETGRHCGGSGAGLRGDFRDLHRERCERDAERRPGYLWLHEDLPQRRLGLRGQLRRQDEGQRPDLGRQRHPPALDQLGREQRGEVQGNLHGLQRFRERTESCDYNFPEGTTINYKVEQISDGQVVDETEGWQQAVV
ncbi:hypothetical protein GCM10027598_78660 [Amycolatopsis oliviviridis]|uniref:Uncharacterized protein n=1 Tax=Amycolatopsis oliviviridis TaxID=1471590 RepID=A0ABQ3L5J8_9PSEU|nr:hypothetical protein GCM10017790_08590 [Amycolatopsis oliviviridis]